MTNISKDNLILYCTIILGGIFIIGYISYPFILSFIISEEQVKNLYIKKFDKIQYKLENIIYECEQVYWKEFENEQKITFTFDEMPKKVKKLLKRENLFSEHTFISIQKDGEKLTVDARFDNYNVWQLRRLPPIVLYYHSRNKNEKRPKDISKGFLVILGNGWSLYKY